MLPTVNLLDRTAVHPAGRHFWTLLGRFAKLGYFRVKRDRDSAAQSPISAIGAPSSPMISSPGANFGVEPQSLVGVVLGDGSSRQS